MFPLVWGNSPLPPVPPKNDRQTHPEHPETVLELCDTQPGASENCRLGLHPQVSVAGSPPGQLGHGGGSGGLLSKGGTATAQEPQPPLRAQALALAARHPLGTHVSDTWEVWQCWGLSQGQIYRK